MKRSKLNIARVEVKSLRNGIFATLHILIVASINITASFWRNRINAENLYALYSQKGARGYNIKQKDGTRKWHSGNFLSYVQRAERKFGKGELISKDTRRHMQKIKKVLKGRQEQEKTT